MCPLPATLQPERPSNRIITKLYCARKDQFQKEMQGSVSKPSKRGLERHAHVQCKRAIPPTAWD
eukprot:760232-Amphidinium_carterae.1